MAGRRELTFAPLPYIVVYQVKLDAIEIPRIFHGAQDWP
jgi:plasmid stabilization system protein ParE